MFRISAIFIAATVATVGIFFAQDQSSGPGAPTGLTCEYLEDPLGVDTAQPRLSWVLEHTGRGQKQTAYQVLVSASPELAAGDAWDTGKVASAQSAHLVYGGRQLESRRTYHWKVRYWDANGRESPWSAPARFETGLMSAAEWRGRWIGGANQLRREFRLDAAPRRARAHVAGLGYGEIRINGGKVGENVLDPGWTTFEKRILYTTYDVTDRLRAGANAVAVMLGQGWYGSRALLLQLEVELESGRRIEVVSDLSWKGHQGPVVSDSVFDGEVYDARLETPGWDGPGFDDSGWKAAEAVEGPKGVLSSQMMPPIRVVDTIVPFTLANPKPGVYVYDLGQNISGWAQLRVRGPRGAAVRLRFAELLYDDGTLNVENLRRAKATDTYVLKGDGEELYEPRFTYHGFRYVEVTGYPGTPTLDSLRGRVVHTAVRTIGGFSCSKPLLNSIQRIVVWGQKTNLHSIPTDCSQRDERMGWMGDAHVTAEGALLNFEMGAFYLNFLRNIRDAQAEDGTITDTVPHKWGRRPADPAWGAAFPLIAWYMYQHYGDRRIVEENYEGVRKWVDYLGTRTENGILGYSYYGDWVAVEKTPGNLVSTFYYIYGAEITASMAEILGRGDETERYREIARKSREAFHQRFFNEETGYYGTGSQTANTLALYLEIPPREKRGGVVSSLTHDIVYRNDTHVTTGFIGVKYLMELLSRVGRSDLAYELAAQTTYPSWGYMIANGATTLWELWQNKVGPSMNSHNHPMFGSVGAWFYHALAGIQGSAESPGYGRIRIAPQMVRDLWSASGSTETVRGTVASAWSRTDRSVRLEAVIPVGSDAEIEIPKLNLHDIEVREGTNPVWREGKFVPGAAGISGARETANAIVFAVGSGRYAFDLAGR